MPAFLAYTACMENRQYTLRSVPADIDRALRRRAKADDKSLNTVAIEALSRDLDALIGSWQEDPGFDQAIADFERVDEEAWK